MSELLVRIRTRFLPALVAALGVAFLTAGLLSYTAPVEAGPTASGPPTIVTLAPTPSPEGTPAASPGPSPTFPPDRVATRVVIDALGIDLPIVRPPGGPGAYPLCDVAMFIQELGQPGQGRATYIYAHARTGMFLPLLTASEVNDGASLLGMTVSVYTSDDQVFLYEITEVRRHATDLDAAIAATTEQLWLQTSEGPKGTRPKLQVLALPITSGPSDHQAAHPTASPRVCG